MNDFMNEENPMPEIITLEHASENWNRVEQIIVDNRNLVFASDTPTFWAKRGGLNISFLAFEVNDEGQKVHSDARIWLLPAETNVGVIWKKSF
jgi:hypothetical protein